ncbi:MAG: class I SAM-dependent methyltransferase [Nitrospiria bacterium]
MEEKRVEIIPHRSQVPSPLLVDHLHRLPRGRALDIASGYGRNAFYLAEQGYVVEGVDCDEEAVAFCNREAERRRLAFEARRVDLEKAPFSLGKGYVLISCFYYLDRKIIRDMKAALRIGGVIVYETFLIDQHQRFGKPSKAEFCWEHNELLRSFNGFRILHYFEGMSFPHAASDADPTEGGMKEGRWVAQLIAERVT